jgi:hypothetical protein
MFLIAAVTRDYLLMRRVRPLTLVLAIFLFLSGPLRAGLIGARAAPLIEFDFGDPINVLDYKQLVQRKSPTVVVVSHVRQCLGNSKSFTERVRLVDEVLLRQSL